MDDPAISGQVKHRVQVSSQPGSGMASLVVPTLFCRTMDDNATIQAIYMLQTRSHHPRPTFANHMPVELRSHGTTCHAGTLKRAL
jgi:hypothetical protein